MTGHGSRLVSAASVMLFSAAAASAQARPSVTLAGYRGLVYLDTVGVVREFEAPALSVTRALGAVMKDMGVAVETDTARGLVANLQIKTQRRFAKLPMSQLLDCGFRERGPNADFYRIHIAFMGMVTPKGEQRTSVRLAFAAGAQDFAGPLADPVACGSTGRLEDRIFEQIARQLKGGPPG